MAVIIDMDMPKRCVECPMHENSNDYCKFRHDFSCFVRAKNACPLKSTDEMIAEINNKIKKLDWTQKIVGEISDIIHKYTYKEAKDVSS